MKPASNPSADEQVVEAITKLREIQKVFAGTPTRDLPFCTPLYLTLENIRMIRSVCGGMEIK